MAAFFVVRSKEKTRRYLSNPIASIVDTFEVRPHLYDGHHTHHGGVCKDHAMRPVVSRETETVLPPKLESGSKTDRFQLVITRSLMQRIGEWRRRQDPIPNVSAAIRRLVEIGLEAEDKRQRG